MKKINYLYLSVVIIFTILTIISCRREFYQENTSTPLTITEAQGWYDSHTLSRSIAPDTGKGMIKNFTSQWNNAIEQEDDRYYALECPLKFDKPIGFLIKE